MPNSTQLLEKIQSLITKNPLAFLAAAFFLSSISTYSLFIRQTKDAEQYWRELYLKERDEKDKLKDELLMSNGIIKSQDKIIQEKDSTLRDNTIEKVETILKTTTDE